MKLKDVIEFIQECEPKFSKSNDERYKYTMFTIPAQHIKANSIEELLVNGMESYKKYGDDSPLKYSIGNDEIKPLQREVDSINVDDYIEEYRRYMTNLFRIDIKKEN